MTTDPESSLKGQGCLCRTRIRQINRCRGRLATYPRIGNASCTSPAGASRAVSDLRIWRLHLTWGRAGDLHGHICDLHVLRELSLERGSRVDEPLLRCPLPRSHRCERDRRPSAFFVPSLVKTMPIPEEGGGRRTRFLLLFAARRAAGAPRPRGASGSAESRYGNNLVNRL